MLNIFKKGKQQAAILMYHRVNTAVSDTWQLCVAPKHFEQQMEVLRDYHVVPVAQLADKKKKIPDKAVAITFDDGYLDNYATAKPILEQYRFPATFFITNSVGENHPEFWWDALERVLLENNQLPAEINLQLDGESWHFNLKKGWQHIISIDDMKQIASWLPWRTPPATQHALFVYLSEWMKALSFQNQQLIISQLYAQTGMHASVRDSYKTVNGAQLLTLHRLPQFTVGGHSAWHTALGKFDAGVQRQAILENKTFLETVLSAPVAGYGYAHGSYNEDSIAILQEAGYTYACTTEEALVDAGTNAFALPRFQVKNWNGAEFKRRLEGWFKSNA
ncbi:polysaccharide deacetylase family protein [Foetidibacter luteolus]|uniref:polysaccharide deacetylase family protein n=1 Tax=Foetidibacter luteolus TaxID=2608880 RepID=UPI001A99BAF2|nr:polysaccharide deacetylase family protein [Foetidibacter luteolus]